MPVTAARVTAGTGTGTGGPFDSSYSGSLLNSLASSLITNSPILDQQLLGFQGCLNQLATLLAAVLAKLVTPLKGPKKYDVAVLILNRLDAVAGKHVQLSPCILVSLWQLVDLFKGTYRCRYIVTDIHGHVALLTRVIESCTRILMRTPAIPDGVIFRCVDAYILKLCSIGPTLDVNEHYERVVRAFVLLELCSEHRYGGRQPLQIAMLMVKLLLTSNVRKQRFQNSSGFEWAHLSNNKHVAKPIDRLEMAVSTYFSEPEDSGNNPINCNLPSDEISDDGSSGPLVTSNSCQVLEMDHNAPTQPVQNVLSNYGMCTMSTLTELIIILIRQSLQRASVLTSRQSIRISESYRAKLYESIAYEIFDWIRNYVKFQCRLSFDSRSTHIRCAERREISMPLWSSQLKSVDTVLPTNSDEIGSQNDKFIALQALLIMNHHVVSSAVRTRVIVDILTRIHTTSLAIIHFVQEGAEVEVCVKFELLCVLRMNIEVFVQLLLAEKVYSANDCCAFLLQFCESVATVVSAVGVLQKFDRSDITFVTDALRMLSSSLAFSLTCFPIEDLLEKVHEDHETSALVSVLSFILDNCEVDVISYLHPLIAFWTVCFFVPEFNRAQVKRGSSLLSPKGLEDRVKYSLLANKFAASLMKSKGVPLSELFEGLWTFKIISKKFPIAFQALGGNVPSTKLTVYGLGTLQECVIAINRVVIASSLNCNSELGRKGALKISPLFDLAALPDDLVLHILSFLSYKRLCRLASMSMAFNRLARSTRLWMPLYLKRYSTAKFLSEGAHDQAPTFNFQFAEHSVRECEFCAKQKLSSTKSTKIRCCKSAVDVHNWYNLFKAKVQCELRLKLKTSIRKSTICNFIGCLQILKNSEHIEFHEAQHRRFVQASKRNARVTKQQSDLAT